MIEAPLKDEPASFVVLTGSLLEKTGTGLTLKASDGVLKQIHVSRVTRVGERKKTDLSQFQPGDEIEVAGELESDGSIAAVSVQKNAPIQWSEYDVSITGTVKSVTGSEVTVVLASGREVKVSADTNTRNWDSYPTRSNEIRPGQQVAVRGKLNPDSSIAASAIEVQNKVQADWRQDYQVTVSGTVQSKTDREATIALPSGREIKISLKGSLRSEESFPIPEIPIRQPVFVTGTLNPDGSVTASTIEKRLPQNPIPDLQRQLDELKRTEDEGIMKRWFSVQLLVDNCKGVDLFFYVRFEGQFSDLHYAKKFDAAAMMSSPRSEDYRTIATGDKYEELTVSDLVPERRIMVFHTIARREENDAVYIAVKDPRSIGDAACGIKPVFFTWTGRITGEKILLTSKRPFAWLRHFQISLNASNTLPIEPKYDKQFLADLANFSAEQSKGLCDHGVCGTEDAHLYTLRHPIANSSEFKEFDSYDLSGADLEGRDGIKDIDRSACAAKCESNDRCKAYTYDKWNKRCYPKSYGGTLRLSAREISAVRSELGVPGRSSNRIEMKQYPNKAFPYDPGNIEATNDAASTEECEERCLKSEVCVAFT
jgi:hypothetical protein